MLADKTPYHTLTGLRFFAALLVYIFHHPPCTENSLLYPFFKELHIGVSVFFTLSGFLICHRYYSWVNNTRLALRAYFVRRVARIFPVLLLVTTVTALVDFEGWKVFFLNITLLKGLSEKYWASMVTQSWSLTTEFCFYLLAPFIFLLAKSFKIWWQCAVLLAIGTLATWLFGLFSNENGFLGSYHFTLVVTFFGRSFEFLAGVYLALLLRAGNKAKTFYFSYTATGLAMVISTAIMLSLIKGDNVSGLATHLGVAINNFLLPIFTSMFMYGLITEQTTVSHIFSSRFMQMAGKASYCFFLLHLGVLYNFLLKYTDYYLMLMGIIFLCSVVLYVIVERPLTIYICNFLKAKGNIEMG